MNYQETLDYIYAQVPMFQNLGAGAYKPGLQTTLTLAEHWGNPHKQLTCIHIAGTNGKGSTASTIAAILHAAGYKVGLYTSPHLIDFRERIRVDGTPVSKDFVVDFVADYLADEELKALHPTFFELTTIMAFRWFADQNVDVAVIEVGLGGRLDCTNIITPILSVITNISLDHTAILGNTEAEIAAEKAGIIKPGVPVVIGNAEGEVLEVFKSKASQTESTICVASLEKPYKSAEITDDGIIYTGTRWGDFKGELCGDCQRENAATVLCALQFITPHFPKIDSEAVTTGFGNVCSLSGLAGRWMELCHTPVRVICDTGHNIGGWRWLGPALKKIAGSGTLHIVIGFVNDKDVTAIMQQMPQTATYYFATPSVQRGRASESTAETALACGLTGKAYKSVAEAFEAAQMAARDGDTIFVGGSTFVVADLLALKQFAG